MIQYLPLLPQREKPHNCILIVKTLGLFATYLFLSLKLLSQSLFTEGVVWPLNVDAGIKEHFVYGLAVAKDGTVLAFSEGRIALGDTKPHHIILKRSKDNGKSWLSSQILIPSSNKESYVNQLRLLILKAGRSFFFIR